MLLPMFIFCRYADAASLRARLRRYFARLR